MPLPSGGPSPTATRLRRLKSWVSGSGERTVVDHERAEQLERRLAAFPRVELVPAPIPLDHLAHLGKELGLDLWLKRVDLTPLALGGDKPRKLEFELGRALAEGADILVTCGSSQSNHARLTVAAARRVGIDAAVVLSRDDYTTMQGNLLTVHLMGADVIIVDAAEHWDLEVDAMAEVERLSQSGRHPYFIPVSGTTALSCLGYVAGALELGRQLEAEGVRPDAVYLPFGTGGIFTANLLALRFLGMGVRLSAVSVNRTVEECRSLVDTWWAGMCELLEIDADIPRGDYFITDEFVGRGYGDPTPQALDAISTLAEEERVLVDPVYSAKVLAALLANAAQGTIAAGSSVVMLHSGGTPAIFAYHEEIARHLSDRRGGPLLE